jgi:hypothetical protein
MKVISLTPRKVKVRSEILRLLEQIQIERETPKPELLAKQQRLLAIIRRRQQAS